MKEKNFPTIPSDREEDLNNLHMADTADLVLFMAGNQFMAMKDLIFEFQQIHPEVRKIFYETLPPGLELKQILTGGAVFRHKVLTVFPDIYTSVNKKAMQTLETAGLIIQGNYQLYLHNRLALMVTKSNDLNIKSIADLSGDNIRISQPDPANEDIAFHIIDMYRKAGGDKLVHRIMEEKRAEGTTVFTIVHHRETPLRILKKTVDVGPVWATEIEYARSEGLDFSAIEPGRDLDQRDRINYYICRLKGAKNPTNAKKFLDFIISPPAQKIYETYGFVPHK